MDKDLAVGNGQNSRSDGKGGYVMYVAQHKTSKAGPAPLSMSRSLQITGCETCMHIICEEESQRTLCYQIWA